MGTLYEQKPRNYFDVSEHSVKAFIDTVANISNETGQTVNQVLKVYEILEMARRNNLFVANGDAWDEQVSGLGVIFSEMTDQMARLNTDLEEFSIKVEANLSFDSEPIEIKIIED